MFPAYHKRYIVQIGIEDVRLAFSLNILWLQLRYKQVHHDIVIDNGKENEEKTEDDKENDKTAFVILVRCREIAFQSEEGACTDWITYQKALHTLHAIIVFNVCHCHDSTNKKTKVVQSMKPDQLILLCELEEQEYGIGH